MKQLSIVLNIVLITAVGLLYYFQFSGKKPVEKKTAAATPVNTGAPMTRPAIAYVELDSLNEKITFIKNKRKELEAEQESIENEWRASYKGLETQRDNFVKKANVTPQEEEAFKEHLYTQQQQIDSRKQELTQKLTEKSYKFMDDLQKKLKDFLAEYNKEKNFMYIFTTGTGLDYMAYKDSSMNITADVIEGMNKKMKAAGTP